MKRVLFLLVATALFFGQALASPVDVNQAKRIGLKYVQSNATRQISELTLAYTQLTENGTPALYVFNFEGGFMIVSADNVAQPILAFGEEGRFDADNISDALAFYLRHYARQIAYAVENNLAPEADVLDQWQQIERNGYIRSLDRGTHDVLPLLTTNWNQDYPYNYYCPTSNYGPGGHVYAGCVAAAMSMVMKYWNWPDHGNGSHSYTPEGYPTQSANFEETFYQWNNMPNSLSYGSPAAQIQAVATLMWHCGIAVDMGYDYDGSGAHSEDVPDAIADYFRYTDHAYLNSRDLFSKTEWENKLIESLYEGFPCYYAGSDSEGGHAFVCDGYRASDRKFHFNWGWGGSGNNNYYAIDALNPPGYHFNEYNRAIFDFIPDYVYNGLIPAVEDLAIEAENAVSKKGMVTWTNPTSSLDGTALENIEQVVLLRNGEQIFAQNNVVPGEAMSFEDNVAEYDCYTYNLYYLSNGTKGRFAEKTYQYGPTCTWKIIGQTTNFQGWNGGTLQVLNSFGSIVDEVTMTTSTPLSKQVRMPEGEVSFKWVAPTSNVSNLTINIKNSSNTSVYSYTGASTGLNGTIYTDSNDCGGCLPPNHFAGEYQWSGEGFGTMLTWSYDTDPQSFKVYRSEDGVEYEEIATVDKTEREYFDVVDAGTYYYKVTAYRSYCESTPAWTDGGDEYVMVNVTSVEENCEKNNVFPNPANESLSVVGVGLQQVVVYNMTGQVVYQKNCDEDGLVINTSTFAPGMYAISIKSSALGTVVRRFAVVH